jgi:hypothetical protein
MCPGTSNTMFDENKSKQQFSIYKTTYHKTILCIIIIISLVGVSEWVTTYLKETCRDKKIRNRAYNSTYCVFCEVRSDDEETVQHRP